PVFMVMNDMRAAHFWVTLPELQQTLLELDRQGRLGGPGNLWIVAIQHMPSTIDPSFGHHLSDLVPKEERSRRVSAFAQLIMEQKSFAGFVYQSANPRRILYTTSCRVPEDAVPVVGSADDDCIIKAALLAVPKAAAYDQLIHHPPYRDPVALI